MRNILIVNNSEKWRTLVINKQQSTASQLGMPAPGCMDAQMHVQYKYTHVCRDRPTTRKQQLQMHILDGQRHTIHNWICNYLQHSCHISAVALLMSTDVTMVIGAVIQPDSQMLLTALRNVYITEIIIKWCKICNYSNKAKPTRQVVIITLAALVSAAYLARKSWLCCLLLRGEGGSSAKNHNLFY